MHGEVSFQPSRNPNENNLTVPQRRTVSKDSAKTISSNSTLPVIYNNPAYEDINDDIMTSSTKKSHDDDHGTAANPASKSNLTYSNSVNTNPGIIKNHSSLVSHSNSISSENKPKRSEKVRFSHKEIRETGNGLSAKSVPNLGNLPVETLQSESVSVYQVKPASQNSGTTAAISNHETLTPKSSNPIQKLTEKLSITSSNKDTHNQNKKIQRDSTKDINHLRYKSLYDEVNLEKIDEYKNLNKNWKNFNAENVLSVENINKNSVKQQEILTKSRASQGQNQSNSLVDSSTEFLRTPP